MSYVKMMFITILAIGMLVGCNNKEPKVESNPETRQVSSDEQVQKDTDVQQTFPFTHFSLDVDYDQDLSYDVEYENEHNRVSAEIEDEVNQVYLEGDAALTELTKYLEQLTIHEQSTEDEVLQQVKDVFIFDENYKSIEVEVRFNDGTKKEYKYGK